MKIITHIAEFEKTYEIEEISAARTERFIEALQRLGEIHDVEVYIEGRRKIGYWEGSGIRSADEKRFEDFTKRADALYAAFHDHRPYRLPVKRGARPFELLKSILCSLLAGSLAGLLLFVGSLIPYLGLVVAYGAGYLLIRFHERSGLSYRYRLSFLVSSMLLAILFFIIYQTAAIFYTSPQDIADALTHGILFLLYHPALILSRLPSSVFYLLMMYLGTRTAAGFRRY